jgi:hypothetical protein
MLNAKCNKCSPLLHLFFLMSLLLLLGACGTTVIIQFPDSPTSQPTASPTATATNQPTASMTARPTATATVQASPTASVMTATHIGIHESEFYGGSEHAEALLAKALNTFEKELQDITPIEPKEHNPFALATQADKDEVIDIIFPPVESDLLISGTITNLKKNLVRQMETVASFTLMGAQVVYVTAFPRTYEKYKEALKEGSLIRAELKHDTSRYPTGHFILVSIITPGAKHG